MRLITAVAAAVALSLVAVPARAHEGGVHLKGTVERIDAAHIVLHTGDGKQTEIALTPETRYVRGDGPVQRTGVRVGERAVVHAKRSGEKLEATLVRLAPRPVAPASR